MIVFITLSYVLNHFIKRNKAFLSKTIAAPRLWGRGSVCVRACVFQPRPGPGPWTWAVWRWLAAAPGMAAGPRVGQEPQTGVQPPGPETWAGGPPGMPCLASSCCPPCPYPAATRTRPHPPQLDSEGLTLAAAGQAPEVLNCWLWRVLSTPEAPVRTKGGLHCLACAGHPGAFVLLRPERRWVVQGEGVRGGLGEMGESLEHARGLTPLRRERTED